MTSTEWDGAQALKLFNVTEHQHRRAAALRREAPEAFERVHRQATILTSCCSKGKGVRNFGR